MCDYKQKKVHINMCPIFDVYGDMGIFYFPYTSSCERRLQPRLRHQLARDVLNSVILPADRLPTTYLLTLWYRVLLEKLTGLQLVKKCPVFSGTQRFITHSQVPANCLLPEPAQSSS
jgi:hypothetical protein